MKMPESLFFIIKLMSKITENYSKVFFFFLCITYTSEPTRKKDRKKENFSQDKKKQNKKQRKKKKKVSLQNLLQGVNDDNFTTI